MPQKPTAERHLNYWPSRQSLDCTGWAGSRCGLDPGDGNG